MLAKMVAKKNNNIDFFGKVLNKNCKKFVKSNIFVKTIFFKF
jgi:hypothetical protein